MNRRILVAVLVAAISLLTASAATARHGRHHHGANGAAKGGNANKGDVWIDNVGQPSGPGHENDPHLACADINLWGAGLADPSGSYTIDGWPPSGKKKMAYSSPWIYNTTLGGSQVLNVINVTTLINNAVANGDTPQAQQGYHFKIQFVQDPQKHKTFWVKCPAPGSTPPPGGSTPPPGGSTPPPGGTTPPPGGSTVTAPGQTTSPSSGVNTQSPSSSAPKKKKSKVLAKRLRRRRGFTG